MRRRLKWVRRLIGDSRREGGSARIVTEHRLTEIGVELLRAAGCSPEDAVTAARMLVWADLRGVSTHGTRLLPMNLRRLVGGGANPEPDIRKVAGIGSFERWDGDFGLGLVLGSFASTRARELATEHGVGVVTVLRSNHYGAAASYVMDPVLDGFVAISMSNSSLSVATEGGVGRTLGNNPIAIGAPGRFPLVLDMSAGISSGARVAAMRRAGILVPDEWFHVPPSPGERPAMRPFGSLEGAGAKGAGIGIMIEVLTGVLSGGGMLSDLMLGAGFSTDTPDNCAHTSIVLDTSRLLPDGTFAERMERLVRELKGAPPAPGVEEVRLPGERAWREVRRRRRDGIPVEQETVDSIDHAAAEIGVSVSW